jgi:NADPH2:quinone reductase
VKVKSIEISAPGNLRVVENDIDLETENLLYLECSAISPLDQQISNGYFPLADKWPLVPGTSGVAVDSTGSRFFVFAEGVGGGFQSPGMHKEAFSFPQDVVFPIPDGISTETVAISMISFLSVFSIFGEMAKIASPRKVLVLGANGSIGEAALLIAEHLGWQATGVTREGIKVLGRDTLTYNDLLASFQGSGYNLIIDPLGGSYTKLAAAFAEPGCQHVVIGLSAGTTIEIDGANLLGKGYRFEGFNLLRIPLPVIAGYVHETFEFLKGSSYCPKFEKKFALDSGKQAYEMAMNSRFRVLLTR